MTTTAVYSYRNPETGEYIDPDTIFSEDKDGIILYQGYNSFRYISKDQLEADVAATDIGYDRPERPALPVPADKTDFLMTAPASRDVFMGRKWAYLFGLKDISITKNKPDNVSAFISKSIDIGESSYIELSAKIDNYSPLNEFSIIENGKETPILPVEETGAIQEKLFNGRSLRFYVDSSKGVSIFKDGKLTTITLDTLNKEADFNSSTYTITYTPVISAHQYHPEGKSVQIKVVQRCLDKTAPAAISSLVILKHGGKKTWTI